MKQQWPLCERENNLQCPEGFPNAQIFTCRVHEYSQCMVYDIEKSKFNKMINLALMAHGGNDTTLWNLMRQRPP